MASETVMNLIKKFLIWLVRFIAYWYNNQPQAGADQAEEGQQGEED